MTTINKNLIRQDFKRLYNFTRRVEGGKVLITVHSEFDIYNPTNEEQPYRSQMEFEEKNAPPRIDVSVRVGDAETLTHGPCSPSRTRERIAELFSQPVTIPPQATAHVTWVYDLTADEDGGDLISFGSPAENATITISTCTDIFSVVVEGIPGADREQESSYQKTWTFNRRIDAGQCLTARWWLKQAEGGGQ